MATLDQRLATRYYLCVATRRFKRRDDATVDIRRHSQTAQTAYHDLVSLLLDDAVSDILGAPTPRERGGRTYWYDRYRIGADTKERYLGEDSESLRRRIERHKRLKREKAERRRERTRLVRLLRSERYLGLDGATGSLIGALAKAGTFRLGGVLVGTIAFRLYDGELGIRLSLDQRAMTKDIDIASFEKLSLAVGESVLPSLNEVLGGFDFEPAPALEPGKVWRWRQTSGEAYIEFLTPSFTEDEEVRELKALGVSAQSLHHLNYLIAEPIAAAAVYRDGILVNLPRPERFAIHKLIVADRRLDGPDSQKARKDLLQAELLISVLAEDRPGDLAAAYQDAMGRGPRWRQRIERSLKRSKSAAERIQAAGRE